MDIRFGRYQSNGFNIYKQIITSYYQHYSKDFHVSFFTSQVYTWKDVQKLYKLYKALYTDIPELLKKYQV